MNVERDSDRQLRAWASEGVDRAPERFVWAALDEIEQIAQRPAWRSRLAGLAGRWRPQASLVGAAAVVVVAVAVLARVVGPTPSPGSARDFVLADLPGIVIWNDTKPARWTLDSLVSNPHEVSVVPVRSLTGAALDRLPLPTGYLGGRYTDFSGPDAVFMSWAALFRSHADAAAALSFYEHELGSTEGWGLAAGRTDLGDDGWRYTGTTTALTLPRGDEEVPADVYLWRHGNLLLAVGGWFDANAAELRTVAEGMDRRADALARSDR